jgi:hypothetical protein
MYLSMSFGMGSAGEDEENGGMVGKKENGG